MKQRRLLAALLLAALVALVLALPASGATPLATLKASLTGEQEVPEPGHKDGSGNAVVKVFKARVCYALEVKRIKPAMAAHIHLGFSGEAGPIVAELKAPTDGTSKGCVAVPRALSLGLKEHPSRYYVNVHNKPFPEGAIRGQLHK